MATEIAAHPTHPAHDETTRPTPAQIDEAVERYEAVKGRADLAAEMLDDAKKELIFLVQTYGVMPAGAEMSKRLEGKLTTLTVTTGNTITLKDDAVVELNNAMSANNQLPLFGKMFTTSTTFSLKKDAATTLRVASLSKRLAETFTTLYARCFDVKQKSPSLSVKRLADKPAKKARGTKGAA